MNQPTLFDQAPQFRVHTKERTPEGTATVRLKGAQLGGNCKKLVQFWQSRWYWISDDDARSMIGVRNLSQRVANIRNENGIAVEDKWNDESKKDFKRYRLKCTCRIVGGEDVVAGCYIHDKSKAI